MTRVIGVDPGSNGSASVFWGDGSITTHNFNGSDLHDVLSDACVGEDPIMAVVEHVGTIFAPGGKVSPKSMFSFGENFGFICGWLRGHGVPYRTVKPQEWQKGLSVGKVKGMDRKRALKAIAARQWPALKVTLANCDSLLIADYGRRVFL